MKTTNWLCWLVLSCVCLAEARYKIRRPPLPPPPQPPQLMFQKSWPIAHRISMGNTVHIGGFPPKRMPQKLPNYRIRRPPMFNVVPNVWKNQIPIRPPLMNHVVLPQRPPIKEFHSMNKMPEYSPEYRPEAAMLQPTHRGGIDDDKGPIHTIPAPNLSPLDRPFNSEINSDEPYQRQYTTDSGYKHNPHAALVPNFDPATIGTSLPPQKTVTSPTPTHQYEVTENNDINQKEYTALPTFLPPEFDVTRQSTVISPDLQTNEVYLPQHPGSNMGLIGTNIQLGQSNAPMQTNLHSSLHVGFPGTAGQAPYAIHQQIPDLHVGHPGSAGPPLSATQLYDLLNSFPQKMTDQYQSGQQPQLQQHILQQQLGQFFQPGVAGFSQPQMQSFNYNEQDNKEQQQQILLGQDYLSGRVNANYNVEQEAPVAQESNNLPQSDAPQYVADGAEHLENNIEYEEPNGQRGQAAFFDKVANNGEVSTQFYTTLPSREAAEKLAALAAAGNVNSHLIQLRKQQQDNAQDSMPANHKDEDYETSQQDDRYEEQKYPQDDQYRGEDRQQHRYQQQADRQPQYEDQKDYDRGTQHSQRQNNAKNEERPLRIMVPDEDEYSNDRRTEGEKDVEEEYEYDDSDATNSQGNASFDGRTSYEEPGAEFGTRLNSKTGK